ncbi:MAG: PP2C family protein-serine/threonine phosphatase [Isosphaeraceae bacterium]
MNPTAIAQEPATAPPEAPTWRERMAQVVATVREMSRQTDPQEMVRAYGRRMREIMPVDGYIALSRRDLEAPKYRITRSSLWTEEINPWSQKDRLPILDRGFLGDLLYGDEPRLIDDLAIDPADPAAEHLEGYRSLVAVPNYDQGLGMNMAIMLRREPAAFDPEEFPQYVWMSNLFGRATHNLVLSGELRKAYDLVERELKIVADIQTSLLPSKLPRIPTLDLAAFYQTSRYAGGDYYDFFHLPDGRWGLLIADVSGHGTPAAVLMAVTHSIAHSYPGSPELPSKLLNFLNHHLAARYTADNGTFVTAFYGIYDPSSRSLTYSCAGHNPPMLRRCGANALGELDGARRLPLGLFEGYTYEDSTLQLAPGDDIIFYTDGIIDANDPEGRLFGVNRLQEVLGHCHDGADALIRSVLDGLDAFTRGHPRRRPDPAGGPRQMSEPPGPCPEGGPAKPTPVASKSDGRPPNGSALRTDGSAMPASRSSPRAPPSPGSRCGWSGSPGDGWPCRRRRSSPW